MTKMAAPPLKITEAAFQEAVLMFAGYTQWLSYHTHDSRSSAKGFPDLTLVRDGEIVFAELKAEGKEPSHEQRVWLTELARGGGNKVRCYVWKPSDWNEIVEVLGAPRKRRQRAT